MDLVTKNLVETFRAEEGFEVNTDPSIVFEHFCNYCILSHEYTDEFDLEDIHTGGGEDLGIDGAAIIVNGALVTTIDEVDDLAEANKFVKAEFVFCQAKSQSNFDGKDISNFFFGIRDLFSGADARLPRNEGLQAFERIITKIYTKSAIFKRGNPSVKMYFVTTGKWLDDAKLQARIDNEKQALLDLNIFSEVDLIPVDALLLQKLYNKAKNRISKSFTFSGRVTLPPLPGVTEAFLGFLPVSEFLKLITDESGNILRGLFYDNVRDFQGDNPVNHEIEQTLISNDRKLFVLLNNGITVVCGAEIQKTGDLFTIEDYQIVNGCQTSHVIYNSQQYLIDKEFQIPVKLIVLKNEEVKNKVVKATNRQTQVKDEELTALTDFQKRLEEYYQAISQENQKLYYERRSQQYRADQNIERIRIVTIANQIRTFASMFLGQAHIASRYYGTLLRTVEGRIFVANHSPTPYYLSAYALFKLESLLRKKAIPAKYRPFKYHLIQAVRLLLEKEPLPAFLSNKFERYCNQILESLWNDERCLSAFTKCCELLGKALAEQIENRDAAKDSLISEKLNALIAETKSQQQAVGYVPLIISPIDPIMG